MSQNKVGDMKDALFSISREKTTAENLRNIIKRVPTVYGNSKRGRLVYVSQLGERILKEMAQMRTGQRYIIEGFSIGGRYSKAIEIKSISKIMIK